MKNHRPRNGERAEKKERGEKIHGATKALFRGFGYEGVHQVRAQPRPRARCLALGMRGPRGKCHLTTKQSFMDKRTPKCNLRATKNDLPE